MQFLAVHICVIKKGNIIQSSLHLQINNNNLWDWFSDPSLTTKPPVSVVFICCRARRPPFGESSPNASTSPKCRPLTEGFQQKEPGGSGFCRRHRKFRLIWSLKKSGRFGVKKLDIFFRWQDHKKQIIGMIHYCFTSKNTHQTFLLWLPTENSLVPPPLSNT